MARREFRWLGMLAALLLGIAGGPTAGTGVAFQPARPVAGEAVVQTDAGPCRGIVGDLR